MNLIKLNEIRFDSNLNFYESNLKILNLDRSNTNYINYLCYKLRLLILHYKNFLFYLFCDF